MSGTFSHTVQADLIDTVQESIDATIQLLDAFFATNLEKDPALGDENFPLDAPHHVAPHNEIYQSINELDPQDINTVADAGDMRGRIGKTLGLITQLFEEYGVDPKPFCEPLEEAEMIISGAISRQPMDLGIFIEQLRGVQLNVAAAGLDVLRAPGYSRDTTSEADLRKVHNGFRDLYNLNDRLRKAGATKGKREVYGSNDLFAQHAHTAREMMLALFPELLRPNGEVCEIDQLIRAVEPKTTQAVSSSHYASTRNGKRQEQTGPILNKQQLTQLLVGDDFDASKLTQRELTAVYDTYLSFKGLEKVYGEQYPGLAERAAECPVSDPGYVAAQWYQSANGRKAIIESRFPEVKDLSQQANGRGAFMAQFQHLADERAIAASAAR